VKTAAMKKIYEELDTKEGEARQLKQGNGVDKINNQ